MTWFTQSANETEAAEAHTFPFLAYEFYFPSGTLRLWTGYGTITFNGYTFTGTGEMGKVSPPVERSRLVPEKRTFELSGVDPAIIPESDFDNSFGRDVIEYFGLANPDTRQPVATPEIMWEGDIDACRSVDGREPVIQVTANHRLSVLDQPDGWRYTHEHQAQFFTGDDGFKLTPTVETAEVIWGGFRVVPGVYTGGGSTTRPSGRTSTR